MEQYTLFPVNDSLWVINQSQIQFFWSDLKLRWQKSFDFVCKSDSTLPVEVKRIVKFLTEVVIVWFKRNTISLVGTTRMLYGSFRNKNTVEFSDIITQLTT